MTLTPRTSKPVKRRKFRLADPAAAAVAQNYPREGSEPVGLHTMTARPALSGTATEDFDSSSVVAAVRRVAAGTTRHRRYAACRMRFRWPICAPWPARRPAGPRWPRCCGAWTNSPTQVFRTART